MSERYRNEAQQRLCKLIVLLAGNEVVGIAPSALARSLDTNPSNITRDLWNLREAGLAERIGDSDQWRLGAKIVQIANAFSIELESRQRRLDEVKQRYTRN